MFCLFIKDFPAVAMQLELKTQQEVVVCSHGRVVSRTRGVADIIQHGISIERAQALAPDSTIVLRERSVEIRVWEMILDQIFTCTPHIYSVKEGIVYCGEDNREKVLRIAARIKASVGCSYTKNLALLAALSAKYRVVHTVKQDNVAVFLSSWPTMLLLDIGYSNELVDRLQLFGFRTYSALMQLNRTHLHAQFGKEGVQLHALMMDMYQVKQLPMYTQPECITASHHFDDAVSEPSVVDTLLQLMMHDVLGKLGHRMAGILEVSLLDRSNAAYKTQSRILRNLTQPKHCYSISSKLLYQLFDKHTRCYGVCVALRSLYMHEVEQLSIYRHNHRIDTVIQEVLRRYPHGVTKIIDVPNAYLHEQSIVFQRY